MSIDKLNYNLKELKINSNKSILKINNYYLSTLN
jgi:hypothetical protein